MSATDPTRAPDWRWRDAVRGVSGLACVPRQVDPLTNRAVTFLRLQRQARTSAARVRLAEKLPTIAEAQRIRFDPNDGRRDAIEVRLLAGYPPGRIAELTATASVVVWAYVALFYDIWDRLGAGDFVWTRVIAFQCESDGESARERKAMRWLAWTCGPLAADALLLPGSSAGFAERKEDIDETLIETTQSLIARAMSLAPLVAGLDQGQARQIMRGRIQARQLRAADSGELGQRRYIENIQAFLDDVELRVGRSSIPEGDNRKYYTSQVEPSADEWAAISRGEPVPEFDAKVAATASIRSRSPNCDIAAQQEEPLSGPIRGSQDG